MAGQNVVIPNVDEATGIMKKMDSQLHALLDDVLKSKAALSGIDLNEAGEIGRKAVEYTDAMADYLTKATEINAQNMKQFNQFVTALAEVEHADFKLG